MPTLVIKGIEPYDGSYEFELEEFTNRELHRMKQATGLRAGELEDAFASGDNDVLIALAIVVLERTGKKVDDNVLWDAPAGSGIAFEMDQEAEELPPEKPLASDDASGDVTTASGEPSPSNSEKLQNGQSRTGHRDSLRSVTSDQATLAS